MTRLRSPNYPGIDLEKAAELAEEIHKKNHQNIISREAAAKDIGYSGLTGQSLKLIAALNQFGLLEKSGKGNVRVTDRAISLIHSIDKREKVEAAELAAASPQLFADILERFPHSARSENSIRAFLVQKGFTQKAMKSVIANFQGTNQFVELLRDSENYKHEEGRPEPASEPDIEEPQNTQEKSQSKNEGTIRGAIFGNEGPLDFNLSSTGLGVAGATTSAAELKAFIAKLEALITLLPDE